MICSKLGRLVGSSAQHDCIMSPQGQSLITGGLKPSFATRAIICAALRPAYTSSLVANSHNKIPKAYTSLSRVYRACRITSGAIQQAVPTPWVMLRFPERATARADPQSPIFASNSFGDFSWMKMLWLFRSLWTMGESLLWRYSMPSATSTAICSRFRVLSRVLRLLSTWRRLPLEHNSETIHNACSVMLHPYRCRIFGWRRKLMMAASPTISWMRSFRCSVPPCNAACANTNSFTATLLARHTPDHTRPNDPSPMILLSTMSLGSIIFRFCWFCKCLEAMARW
mmetsp:Transcript_5382/g.7410  ORF Transcript_5382/g.7410 Transcript_5382/m.7410 type:complete len:284 (-) Transcript_5382:359-1210(-)